MWIFIGLVATFVIIVSLALMIDAGRSARREEADSLEAARLRLLAAGEDVDGTADYHGTVYASTAATGDDPPPVDTRIAELAADPTLTDLDVVTAVEHVAPGVGSLASFAATVDDTRMRTLAEVRALEAAEAEAYAEIPAQEERLYYAAFELRWQAMLTDFEVGTRAVRRVNARHHASVGENTCTLCMVGVQEISDEFQQIVARVESTDTGEISRADLNRMLANR